MSPNKAAPSTYRGCVGICSRFPSLDDNESVNKENGKQIVSTYSSQRLLRNGKGKQKQFFFSSLSRVAFIRAPYSTTITTSKGGQHIEGGESLPYFCVAHNSKEDVSTDDGGGEDDDDDDDNNDDEARAFTT